MADEAALRQVLEENDRVVVAFRADWSDRCKQLEAELGEYGAEPDEYGGTHLVSVDVDANPVLAYRYDVTRIPTLLRFEDEEVVGRAEGVPDDVCAFVGAELIQ